MGTGVVREEQPGMMEDGLAGGDVMGGGKASGGVTMAAEAAGIDARWAKKRGPRCNPG